MKPGRTIPGFQRARRAEARRLIKQKWTEPPSYDSETDASDDEMHSPDQPTTRQDEDEALYSPFTQQIMDELSRMPPSSLDLTTGSPLRLRSALEGTMKTRHDDLDDVNKKLF